MTNLLLICVNLRHLWSKVQNLSLRSAPQSPILRALRDSVVNPLQTISKATRSIPTTITAPPFRYLLDRLFLGSCLLYALNRWILKPHTSVDFLHSHFNDLLLIPCALPPMLLLHRKLGLRSHDDPPTSAEILFHLLIWSVFCEIAGPRWLSRGTADPLDIAAYATGALLAALWWHRTQLPSLKPKSA